MKPVTKIRWVIAHEPIKLFYRAAKDFEQSINEQQSEERIEVEIMTPKEYSDRYNNGELITKHQLLELMEEGKIECSQMYTTWLAEKYEEDFLAFEMPFLFTDHDHATRVLEGPIGEGILDKLNNNSNVRGLSYTYSGGFRCFGVNKEVHTLDDLAGEILRSNRNPVAQSYVKVIADGATPYVCEVEDATERVREGLCNGIDTVFSRMYPLKQNEVTQTVVDSKHSMFLTTMLVSDKFWNSLTPEIQKIIKTAAIEAGRKERETTIIDGQEAREQLIKDGVRVVDPTEAEMADLKSKMEVVYNEFKDFFPAGLIDSIKKA